MLTDILLPGDNLTLAHCFDLFQVHIPCIELSPALLADQQYITNTSIHLWTKRSKYDFS